MYKSELIPEIIFLHKEETERFDNVITKILHNKDTKSILDKVKYPSHYAALRAIEMNEFHFQLLNLNDEDFNELISLCENIECIINGNIYNECYKIPLNYIYLKIYNLENIEVTF